MGWIVSIVVVFGLTTVVLASQLRASIGRSEQAIELFRQATELIDSLKDDLREARAVAESLREVCRSEGLEDFPEEEPWTLPWEVSS